MTAPRFHAAKDLPTQDAVALGIDVLRDIAGTQRKIRIDLG
ncbi:MAG: hypothetical protein V4586_14995 [Pseudomonadota bacterium]